RHRRAKPQTGAEGVSQTEPLTLPDYGLGAAGLGNLYFAISDETVYQTLQAAQHNGMTYIDTAPYYGHGLSEQRIGAFLSETSARVMLSTKVGRRLVPAGNAPIPDNGFADPAPFIPQLDYSSAGIRASFEGSQKRLGVEAVDILLLHDIGELTHGEAHETVLRQAFDEALPEMAALKSEGKTRWIGLGVNEIAVCEQVLEQVDLDCVLLAGRYTLLEHEASQSFLDECYRRGVRVIIGGAFNSGLLAAPQGAPLNYDYVAAPGWAVRRVAELRSVCVRHGAPLAAAALQFCRAHPAVASVIPGARSVDEVRQISGWTATRIEPALWAELKERKLISADAPVPA
ncbi:aldo/keto reductase, partial [Hyphomonas pacifica]|uniref:aldo/keto reductase n=1 Tax=Hyphomonas pacifica TaxID=1280941 RepID=UPI000DBF957A